MHGRKLPTVFGIQRPVKTEKATVRTLQESGKFLNKPEADQHKSYEVKPPNGDREASINSAVDMVERSLRK